MENQTIIKENWLTKKLPKEYFPITLFLVFFLLLGSLFYQHDLFNMAQLLPATGSSVLKHKEYWRLWTALFAHADLEHILGNLFLFIPFSYYLSRNFSWIFFPLIGFLLGGLINYIVIKNLPEHVSIIGVSGVVYWMGSAWMTLLFFIDRRLPFGTRLLKISGVSLILFFPTTILPEVSYLSHFLGYIFGIISGAFYYLIYKNEFISAEITENIKDKPAPFDWENFSLKNISFKPLRTEDFPMLHEWLNREHILKNWGGPTELSNITTQYESRLHSDKIFPFIVYANELPIGFIQAYNASYFQNGLTEEVQKGIFGIDQFIADRNLLGKGIGSTFIKKFTDTMLLQNDIVSLISTPPLSNTAAIRAYQKAGFHRKSKIRTHDGMAMLMEKNK